MKCKLEKCNIERTLYKGSNFCKDHTCENWDCKNAKNIDDAKFCKQCCCVKKNCIEKKSFESEACYIHKCKNCNKKQFVDTNDEKLCDICIKQCTSIFCKDERMIEKNSKFCKKHTCEIQNCLNRSYDNRKHCNEKHCCMKCFEYRGDSKDDKYCFNCLNKCFKYDCNKIRPKNHVEQFYYCNDHGCLDCNGHIKHTFYFLREKQKSEYCKNHYLCEYNNCKWYKINDSNFCKKHL